MEQKKKELYDAIAFVLFSCNEQAMISCGRVHLSHTHTPIRIGRQTGRQSAVTLRQEAWCCCFDRLVSAFTLHYHSAE